MGEVLKRTSNEAIQMHGGIGVTDDVDIGFYLKRARVIQYLFGDTNYHLNAIAKIKGYWFKSILTNWVKTNFILVK